MAPQKCFAQSPVLNALKYLDKLIGLLCFSLILINRGWLDPNILQRALKLYLFLRKGQEFQFVNIQLLTMSSLTSP